VRTRKGGRENDSRGREEREVYIDALPRRILRSSNTCEKRDLISVESMRQEEEARGE